MNQESPTYVAFQGHRQIAKGSQADVAVMIKALTEGEAHPQVLIFRNDTGAQVDLDLRGTLEEVRERNQPETRQGPGRPKLGVVAREVTLLPRHWEWLSEQPGGASVALRKLVEEARKSGQDRRRAAKDAANRFMSVVAGDLPNFEEATRALYAGDQAKFEAEVGSWPADVKNHARTLAEEAF